MTGILPICLPAEKVDLFNINKNGVHALTLYFNTKG